MEGLIDAYLREQSVQKIMEGLKKGKLPALLSGTAPIHRSALAAILHERGARPVAVVCADEGEAKKMLADIAAFSEAEPIYLPARDFVFRNVEGVSRGMEQERLRSLCAIGNGKAPIVVTTPEALMQRSIPKDRLLSSCCTLENGGEILMEKVTDALTAAGYVRSAQVEGPGQFAVRGGILDFCSPGEEYPVRVEFFGDEIDSMGYFDISTQRRIESREKAEIMPAMETLVHLHEGGSEGLAAEVERQLRKATRKKNRNEALEKTLREDADRIRSGRELPAADRYMELIYPMSTAAEYFSQETTILLCEPGRLEEHAKNWTWQLHSDEEILMENGSLDGSLCSFLLPWEQVLEKLGTHPVVMADNFTMGTYPYNPRTLETLTARQLPSYGGSLETATEDISHYQHIGSGVLVLCGDLRRCSILEGLLGEKGIHASTVPVLTRLPRNGECYISVGNLSAGFEFPDSKFVLITEGQMTANTFRKKVRKKAASNRQKLDSFTDLSPGDLVVHSSYGIGRFVGIVKMNVDKVEKDYIKISFSGTDNLYIPATQLDAISKYIGSEEENVKLSKLGTTDWVKAKTKAKHAAKDMAKDLIQIQARRRRQPGYAFSPDSPWQTEFENSFAYQETDDQLRSIQEIKADMEKPIPMDRLLCGDVGYGKTEVALRAVMKCILDGKQAAILVPTTVLAQQHYQTAMSRFSGYPVSITVLSRFRTNAQMMAALRGTANGSIDIVIGTHRLLQKDLHFKDLGLLVIDEEQRFGVGHKEKLKELCGNVDILTLSATPIPRTLNMSLSGLKEMSTLEEPPQDRQPVQTYVMEHDWGVLADAIRREVSRGGQVYYLHNRVETIDRAAAKLGELLEGVNIGIAHGRMDEKSLSRVMEQMATGELDVLVCTTIIETGIDIPNVNTLIIEDADKLGLAQLHQIRGRVGRSSRRAYAYFTFRKGKILTEVAEKRLSAIREFAEFNSGFKIAMRDLEIRGAGNILGAEQSGHIYSVGFDMYLQLLEEAVLEEQGLPVKKRTECSADLTVSAGIPEEYIPSPEQRMDLYRRIAHIRSEEDAADMTDELIDRFGDPPKEVLTLIRVAQLRGVASEAGISDITQKQGKLRFCIADFQMEPIAKLTGSLKYKSNLRIDGGSVPAVTLKLMPGADPVAIAATFVKDYSAAKNGKETK